MSGPRNHVGFGGVPTGSGIRTRSGPGPEWGPIFQYAELEGETWWEGVLGPKDLENLVYFSTGVFYLELSMDKWIIL